MAWRGVAWRGATVGVARSLSLVNHELTVIRPDSPMYVGAPVRWREPRVMGTDAQSGFGRFQIIESLFGTGGAMGKVADRLQAEIRAGVSVTGANRCLPPHSPASLR